MDIEVRENLLLTQGYGEAQKDIYIYIYIQRERERVGGESFGEPKRKTDRLAKKKKKK